MKTYNYKIQNGRKIIKENSIKADSLEEAHGKLKNEYADYIIYIDGVRFPPVSKLEMHCFKLTNETKKLFNSERAKTGFTVNSFFKEVLEFYKENHKIED